MGICKRRLLLLCSWFCFLLPAILLYFLFSSNYTKLESPVQPVPNTLKLILEDINVSVEPNDGVCRGHGQVLILQLITSHAGNGKLRQRTRKEFNSAELAKLGIRRVFLVSQTPSTGSPSDISNRGKFRIPSKREILEENGKYGDLIIGTFAESYRNLTYKHLMGLGWATKYCSQAKFVLKQDDDIYVDLYGLVDRLQNSPLGQALQSRGGIYGKVLQNRRVERARASKWFVTHEEFGSESYPDYVSGWAYVTTPSTIQHLLEGAGNVNFFWIDDVLVTGILRRLASIELIDGSDAFAVTRDFFDCCRPAGRKGEKGSYWCDFIFGPSPGDATRSHLVSHSRLCYMSGRCRRRALKESLLHTCVITRDAEMHPQEMRREKGRPLWEPIKLGPST